MKRTHLLTVSMRFTLIIFLAFTTGTSSVGKLPSLGGSTGFSITAAVVSGGGFRTGAAGSSVGLDSSLPVSASFPSVGLSRESSTASGSTSTSTSSSTD